MEKIDLVGSSPSASSSKERFWASIAHISTLVTLFVSVVTVGIGAIPFIIVPLIIYLVFKDKSEYVAYQAMQAFALQIIISVGFFVALILLTLLLIIIWLISLLLVVILIGIVLLPVAAIITVAVVLALVALPFVIGVLAIMGSVETAQGRPFTYPFLDDIVTRWITGDKPAGEPMV